MGIAHEINSGSIQNERRIVRTLRAGNRCRRRARGKASKWQSERVWPIQKKYVQRLYLMSAANTNTLGLSSARTHFRADHNNFSWWRILLLFIYFYILRGQVEPPTSDTIHTNNCLWMYNYIDHVIEYRGIQKCVYPLQRLLIYIYTDIPNNKVYSSRVHRQ